MNEQTARPTIHDAFTANAYSSDAYFQGSTEGTEAYQEVETFRGNAMVRSQRRPIAARVFNESPVPSGTEGDEG